MDENIFVTKEKGCTKLDYSIVQVCNSKPDRIRKSDPLIIINSDVNPKKIPTFTLRSDTKLSIFLKRTTVSYEQECFFVMTAKNFD